MILANEGLPSLWLILAVLIGGSMAAGGANTINCWIERDRDSLMRRTHGRPLPSGDINPTGALIFGLVLEVLAFALLWATSNLLAASLAVSATLFYVFVYTLWLKRAARRTSSSAARRAPYPYSSAGRRSPDHSRRLRG